MDTRTIPDLPAEGSANDAKMRQLPLPSVPANSTIEGMTVGIGVLCEKGRAAVVAADRMQTFGAPVGFLFDGAESKIIRFRDRILVAISGTFGDAEAVLDKAMKAGAGAESLTISAVADRILTAAQELRDEQWDLATRRAFGLSITEFRAKVVAGAPALSGEFDRLVKQNLALSLLLVGQDATGCHLRVIEETVRLSLDAVGFAAIGSGWVQATLSLARRPHLKSASLPDGIYAAYEAKRAAEYAGGVGRATDIAVIRQDGRTLFLGEDAINVLEKTHAKLRPPPLSDEDRRVIENCMAPAPDITE